MSDQNQKTYASAGIVWYYIQLSLLQPAEKTVLDRFKDQLSTMSLLDIGIGGGRTTQHFAPLAKAYTGIDYSAEMIAACQQKFSGVLPPASLNVGDARDMSQFADNTFDFILFSFNGIDYVSHCDRLRIFQEVNRVGKSGSYFFFSSHNLQGIDKEFSFREKISLNPLKTYVNLIMVTLLRLFNLSIKRQQLKTADYLIIKDESHNFRLQTYYIRPEAQIQQLKDYFSEVEVYSWKSGQRIADATELSANSEMWLYYLCVIS